MPLYLISRDMEDVGVYEYMEFVVRAKGPKQARRLAAEASSDEGYNCWIDPALTKCKAIRGMGDSAVVLGAYRAA